MRAFSNLHRIKILFFNFFFFFTSFSPCPVSKFVDQWMVTIMEELKPLAIKAQEAFQSTFGTSTTFLNNQEYSRNN